MTPEALPHLQRAAVVDALANLLAAAAREPSSALAELSPRGVLGLLQVRRHELPWHEYPWPQILAPTPLLAPADRRCHLHTPVYTRQAVKPTQVMCNIAGCKHCCSGVSARRH